MKAYTDGDRVGVETDPHDAELASAVKALIADGKELADAAGWLGREPCDACDTKARLRPFALIDKGEFFIAGLCADCQRQKVEEKAEQYRREQAGDDDDTVDVDVELEDANA